jgi:predicted O-methyltransferase YrrM
LRIKRWNVLLKLVHFNDWRSGAEIGVHDGTTYFHLLENAPDLTMIAVDSWPEQEPFYGDLRPVAERVKARAEGFGERAWVLHGDSAAMAHEVADGVLDFVFIDGDHSTEGLLTDLAAWRVKLKPGGKIIGHDIDWPDVEKVVSRVFGEYQVLPDDVWMAA